DGLTSGWTVAGAGDTDADGSDDYLVGNLGWNGYSYNPGAVWLYSGANGSLIQSWIGASNGSRMRRLGDIDGDGYADYAFVSQDYSHASVDVVSGRTETIIGGISGGSSLWLDLDGAVDVTGDGVPDLLGGFLGEYFYQTGGFGAGGARVCSLASFSIDYEVFG